MTILDLLRALEASARHYDEMLEAMTGFAAATGAADPEAILAFAADLHRRRREVEVFDRNINVLLQDVEPDAQLASALDRRLELMERVQANNRLLSEKIRGMMSVISSELAQARGGRAAMSGYRNGAAGRGGAILSGNF